MKQAKKVERRVTATAIGFVALAALPVVGFVVALWLSPVLRENAARVVGPLPVRLVVTALFSAWWLLLAVPRIARYAFNAVREHLRVPHVQGMYRFVFYGSLLVMPALFFVLLSAVATGSVAALVLTLVVLAALLWDGSRFLDLEMRRLPEDAIRQELHETGEYEESALAQIELELQHTTDPLERWSRRRRLLRLRADLANLKLDPEGPLGDARSGVAVKHFERKTAEERARQAYRRLNLEDEVERAKRATELAEERAKQTRLESPKGPGAPPADKGPEAFAAGLIKKAKNLSLTADLTMQLGDTELDRMGVADPETRERFLAVLEALVEQHLREHTT